jgi:DNA polymerase-3 subunit delta'
VAVKGLLRETDAYKRLVREWEKGTLSHAYLVTFDDGKYLPLALAEFAKVIFGAMENEYGEFNSREEERVAGLIDGGKYIDCKVYPADGKRLTAEEAAEIALECQIKAVESDRKVFIIDKFDEALAPAQNKLLKMLEEPPEGVVFLLGARKEYSVLATVRSRTAKLEIRPFAMEAVKACLARAYGAEYSDGDLAICAAAGGGSVGTAENYLYGGLYARLSEAAFSLCLAEEKDLPALVKTHGETKYKKELLAMLSLIFRDALILKTAVRGVKKTRLLLPSEEKRTGQVCAKRSLRALVKAQEYIVEAEKQVKFNAVFPQCLELLILRIIKEK